MDRTGPRAGGSILFLVRGGETVPSCRFRAFQFREPLRRAGVRAEYVILEKSWNPFRQLLFHLKLIPVVRRHHAVIFQKLLEPWRLAFLRLLNGNVYYDFDDAMYAAPDSAKFPATVRIAPRVIAGNAILAERARRFNRNVLIVPTVVPIPDRHPKRPDPSREFVLSWIGTSANLPYLSPVLDALETLHGEEPGYSLRILTERPDLAPKRSWITALKWSREAEEREFRDCDVGLMPLQDTEWCAGKCACKALQYLSYGKPVISSPVGVNRELFSGAPFGVLAVTAEEWKRAILEYRSDPDSALRAGEAGHVFVRERYNLESWAGRLADMVLNPENKEGP
jgi:glycosyltransferase involved in cell wall biosynthesis